MRTSDWAGVDSSLAMHVLMQSEACIRSYRENPLLVEQDAAIEIATSEGGYGRKQLYELIQNAADASLAGVGGIEVVLTDLALYCANRGAPVTPEGADSLMMSHLSRKRGAEIGRFGLGFKSVVGVTDRPQIFSRAGSFGFDKGAARQRIRQAVGEFARYPTLRIAAPLDPQAEAAQDAELAKLMQWADTIVRLPLRQDVNWLADDVLAFPAEFLLFSPHVQGLVLRDIPSLVDRRITTVPDPDAGLTWLDESGERRAWRVFSAEHAPSGRARANAGQLAERSSISVRWAVPEKGRQRLGSLWAYFPTASLMTLGGILNAPWKTNDDRHDILEGEFNAEILTEVLPALVADALTQLVDPQDPASLLDLLPARGRESRSWADDVMNGPVYAALSGRESLPDCTGTLRVPDDLRLHPRGMPAVWLEDWAAALPEPERWAHPGVDANENRRARAERIMGFRAPVTLAEWLEALADPPTSTGSSAAVLLAVTIRSERPELFEEIASARVLLTRAGHCVGLTPGSAFLPTEGLEADHDLPFVQEDVLAVPGVVEALGVLGIGKVDRPGLLRRSLRQLPPAQDEAGWRRLWAVARDCGPDLAATVMQQERVGLDRLRVRTLHGDWTPMSLTLLPGEVVPRDGSRDGHVAVDVDEHREDLALLAMLGLTPTAVPGDGGLGEAWMAEYRDFAITDYYRQLPAGGSKPNPDYLVIDEQPVPRSLGVLPLLSEEGRAALSVAALGVASPGRFQVRHRTQPQYPVVVVEDALSWWLRRHGRLPTPIGPWPVVEALAPTEVPPEGEDAKATVLPVAQISAAEAHRLGLHEDPTALPAAVWDRLVQLVAGWEDDSRRGHLYAFACTRVSPGHVTARSGGGLVCVPPSEAYVVAGEREFDALVAQHIPTVLAPHAEAADALSTHWHLRSGAVLLDTEVLATPDGEVVPLLDRFPPLRLYTDEDLTELELVPCQDIAVVTVTPRGRRTQSRDFFRQGQQLYHTDMPDGALLHAVSDELDLSLEAADVRHVLTQVDLQRAGQRAVQVRQAADDDERLVRAVSDADLRRTLPELALKAVEDRRGAPLEGTDLARAARAVHGISLLSRLRDALVAQGFEAPERWGGSATARRFVRDLGFAPELAGFEPASRAALLEVDGPTSLKPAHDYQEAVMARIDGLLKGEGPARGMVSLPTGAGKTRVAVEALVRRAVAGRLSGSVVWIAQTDELCEQAVQTWSYVWRAAGPEAVLHISRLWGNNDAAAAEGTLQLVVATNDKLHSVMRREEYAWLQQAGVVVVDEAHTSITPTSTAVLEWLGRGRSRKDRRPLIGLTATPFRGVSAEETARLASRYDRNRLDAGAFDGDPHLQLQSRGVLAAVRHRLLSGVDVDLEPAEVEDLSRFGRSRTLETRLGTNVDRNRVIVDSLLTLPEDWTVLVFATSVANAEILAAMLAIEGMSAVAISGATEPGARRHYVEEFRQGRLRVITNYNVLAQGFDAPAVRAVYVTRPTFSPNVYQQMIGRGLRGRVNGGSDEVLIVNLEDNFQQFGGRLAFHGFEYLWHDDEHQGLDEDEGADEEDAEPDGPDAPS